VTQTHPASHYKPALGETPLGGRIVKGSLARKPTSG
jgi:hypothetical protein